MKLPEDKKERTKILILIALGSFALLYGVGVLVVKPVIKGKKEQVEKTASLQEKLRRASLVIDRIGSDKTSNSNILAELDVIANQKGMVLRDRLGNFLLGATEIIDAHARGVGISGQVVSESGILQVPQSTKHTAPAAFSMYTVTVRLETGANELLRMLQSLERSNPYLCISSLAIAGQPDKPGKHAVSFEVQWPIWADPETPQRLQNQLKELENPGSTTPVAAPSTEAGSTEKASK